MKKSAQNAARRAAQGGKKPPKIHRPSGSFAFPQVRGKTLTDAYVITESDLNCLTLCFDDNTELVLDVEPCLRFAADYSDWKTGEERVIKRWPRVRSS
jgi:hypothetical protein